LITGDPKLSITYELYYSNDQAWDVSPLGAVSSFDGTTITVSTSDESLPDVNLMKIKASFAYNPTYTVKVVNFSINLSKCFRTIVTT
jgi:hypothetical protein